MKMIYDIFFYYLLLDILLPYYKQKFLIEYLMFFHQRISNFD